DVIMDHKELGHLIPITNRKFNQVYQSITCSLTNDQCSRIWNLIQTSHDHEKIKNVFQSHYNIARTAGELSRIVNRVRTDKTKRVITLATDTYANNLNYLLSSLRYTNPTLCVTVHCVNWSDDLLNSFIY